MRKQSATSLASHWLVLALARLVRDVRLGLGRSRNAEFHAALDVLQLECRSLSRAAVPRRRRRIDLFFDSAAETAAYSSTWRRRLRRDLSTLRYDEILVTSVLIEGRASTRGE